jgi:NitT/TauT family transport system substrate-binding protein
MLAALEQDQVWAGVIVDPLASQFERDGIAKPLYDTRTEKGTLDVFGGPWPAGGFYTTEDFVRQHPAVVQSLVRAGVRALRYIKEHPAEELASAVPESFWGGDRNYYVSSLRANLGLYSTDGVMPADGALNVLQTLTLVDNAIAEANVEIAKTYDNSFVEKAR